MPRKSVSGIADEIQGWFLVEGTDLEQAAFPVASGMLSRLEQTFAPIHENNC